MGCGSSQQFRFLHFSKLVSLLVIVALVFGTTTDALAGKKKKRKKSIKVSENYQVLSNVKDKAQSGYACLRKPNGQLVSGKLIKDGDRFKVFKPKKKQKRKAKKLAKTRKRLNRQLKKKPGNAKLLNKVTRIAAQLEKLNPKMQKRVCREAFESENGGGGGGGGEQGTTTALDFTPHEGRFGIREARILFSRFAFGANRGELEWAANAGLTEASAALTTWKNEPSLDAESNDIRCDEYLQREELWYDDDPDDDNEQCNRLDPTNFEIDGMVQSYYYRFMRSSNPFFYRLMLFFHDERMAAQCDNLPSKRRHFAPKHFDFLMNVAKTMDYAYFIRYVKDDPLVAYHNLDLGENSVFNELTPPNENFAREWLELASMGPTDFSGNPNYGPFDVAELANALSGRGYNEQNVPTGIDDEGEMSSVDIENPAIVPAAFVQGPKTIFIGTPFQTRINDAEDAADAILSHPQTYFSLAEELIKEYLHPNPDRASIQFIADLITADRGKIRGAILKIMRSKELYKSSNEKLLIKTPSDLAFGFLRATGIPYSHRTLEYDLMPELGQALCSPGNDPAGQIFGWKTRQLAGEAFVIQRRNFFLSILTRDSRKIADGWNYSWYDQFVADLDPGLAPASALVASLSELLGVELTPEQGDEAVRYLNYNWEECNSYEVDDYGCTEGEYFAKREAFDPAIDAPDHLMRFKVMGVLALLAMQSQYHLK